MNRIHKKVTEQLEAMAAEAAQLEWEDSLDVWRRICTLLDTVTGHERGMYESAVCSGYRLGRAADLGLEYHEQRWLRLNKIPGYLAVTREHASV